MTTDRSDVERIRADLAATVDAIQYKLDLPKRVSARLRRLRAENPVALGGMVAGAVAAIGGAIWFLVRAARR
ncbi:MAG TPA: DUF3618 domain-containing protein [Leifsonia sp.]|jgi:radical SAM superfamily enzyme YgiQ (UPF0313 family)